MWEKEKNMQGSNYKSTAETYFERTFTENICNIKNKISKTISLNRSLQKVNSYF